MLGPVNPFSTSDYIFSKAETLRGQPGRNNGDMRWLDLRTELRRMRLLACPNQSEFAMVSGLNRKTVNRIEAINRDVDYKPEYDTVDAWLKACGSSSAVSDFYRTFEDRVTSPITLIRDTFPIASSQPGETHGSAATPAGVRTPDDDAAALLEQQAFALLRAVAALRRDAEIRYVDEGQSDRSRASDTVGGSDPAHLQRVT